MECATQGYTHIVDHKLCKKDAWERGTSDMIRDGGQSSESCIEISQSCHKVMDSGASLSQQSLFAFTSVLMSGRRFRIPDHV